MERFARNITDIVTLGDDDDDAGMDERGPTERYG